MSRLSLRTRLVLGMIGLMTLGLLIADAAGLVFFRAFQFQRVDDQLSAPFGEAALEQAETWLNQTCEVDDSAAASQLPTTFAILTTDAAGAVRCQLPEDTGFRGNPVQTLSTDELAAAATDQTIVDLPSTTGPVGWRARVARFDDGFALLAVSLLEVEITVGRLARIMLTVGLLILAAAAVAGIAVVRVALRPLTTIEHTAGQIAAGNLTQRITVDDPRTEVGRLAASLNGMLTRIEAAFTERDRTEHRLRRFVADASHELRTPLATIRGHAELVRQGAASSPDQIATVLDRIESESIRMTALVDDLLLLARLDTTPVLSLTPLDLLSVAADTVADARARTPERPIKLTSQTQDPWQDQPPIVSGDSARLGQILTNLLSNADKYSPARTPIEVEVGVHQGRAIAAVIDHGPGLRPGNEERVFERFFREDPGRSRRQGGTGLGLAIAWSLTTKHGGTLTYHPTPGGGSTFVLSLPLTEM